MTAIAIRNSRAMCGVQDTIAVALLEDREPERVGVELDRPSGTGTA